MGWEIYYGDKSTFSSEDGDPFHAPQNNVQVVNNNGKLYYGKDAYYWRPDVGWNACDIPGLWDYLLMYRGPKAVLFGRSIRDEDFWETVKRAKVETSQH